MSMTAEEAHRACTVVVASCDAYADLLGPFSSLWRRHWLDCPFDVVLVTETAPSDDLAFDRTIACGPGGNWCSRLALALGEIDTPYVMLLCDDYYLADRVDTPRILTRLEQAMRYDAANLRLIPNPEPTASRATEFADGLFSYRRDTAYCVATQAGFWNREFLGELAVRYASIWEFERYGSFAVGGEARPLLVTPSKEFPFVDAVHKGYWERFGVETCRAAGIEPDLSVRGLPPLKVRITEALKALVFALVPNDWIVRMQNRYALGKKEKPRLT